MSDKTLTLNKGAGIDPSLLSPEDAQAALQDQIKLLLIENAKLRGSSAAVLPESGLGQFGKARYGIVLDEGADAQDLQVVPIQINGFAWQITRGRYVEVPQAVLGVLNDAVVSKGVSSTDANGMPSGVTFRNSRRFPYQNYGMVIDETGKRIKDAMPDQIAA